jgi:ABC-type bacteriocin/lantibiotic exporter with double-glycine peptidase domain
MSMPAGEISDDFALSALASGDVPLSPVERLRRLAGLERGDIGVVVVYAVAIGLVSLAVPIAAQSLVNTVAFTALLQPIIVLSVLVLIGLIAAGVLRALQCQVVETLQQRLFVRTTHEAVTRLTRADVRAFAEKGAPELMNRFFDVALVQKAAATLLLDGLSVVLQGAVSLVLLAFYHPALLAFDVVLIGLIAFILLGLGRAGVASAIKESKAKYATAAWLEEVANAFRAFKSQESAVFAFARADALARTYVEARRQHFKVLFRQILSSYLLQAIATAALLGLGGWLVIAGQLTLGQLVAAELIVTGVLAGVSKFGKYLESFYDLAASVDKVGAIVDIASERDGMIARAGCAGPAHLGVEHVSFTYDGKTDALRDVSFEIAPASHVAILGSDASGKSTLVDLLYGLRTPSRGWVKLDGVDLRTLRLADLREDVVLVGEPEIFEGTVLDNVRFGRTSVDGHAIAEALEAVALSEEVGRLPDGALTNLGPKGSRLTSSQAARLMIARALVAVPRLLIIDEALDGLRTDTARKVLAGLGAIRHRTSVIVFTSREEIAAAVGAVLRLDGGVLALGPVAPSEVVP